MVKEQFWRIVLNNYISQVLQNLTAMQNAIFGARNTLKMYQDATGIKFPTSKLTEAQMRLKEACDELRKIMMS